MWYKWLPFSPENAQALQKVHERVDQKDELILGWEFSEQDTRFFRKLFYLLSKKKSTDLQTISRSQETEVLSAAQPTMLMLVRFWKLLLSQWQVSHEIMSRHKEKNNMTGSIHKISFWNPPLLVAKEITVFRSLWVMAKGCVLICDRVAMLSFKFCVAHLNCRATQHLCASLNYCSLPWHLACQVATSWCLFCVQALGSILALQG